jgi:5-methylcytosine-specific restriction protein A
MARGTAMSAARMTSPHQHLYDTGFWKRRSRLQLLAHPLCMFCEKQGKVTPARVADHITPHRGDRTAFFLGELQSLCWSCHSASKQQIERQGFACDIGLDGLPLDPNHPCYRR